MSTLGLCGQCGSRKATIERIENKRLGECFRVYCGQCGTSTKYYVNEEDAVTAWERWYSAADEADAAWPWIRLKERRGKD